MPPMHYKVGGQRSACVGFDPPAVTFSDLHRRPCLLAARKPAMSLRRPTARALLILCSAAAFASLCAAVPSLSRECVLSAKGVPVCTHVDDARALGMGFAPSVRVRTCSTGDETCYCLKAIDITNDIRDRKGDGTQIVAGTESMLRNAVDHSKDMSASLGMVHQDLTAAGKAVGCDVFVNRENIAWYSGYDVDPAEQCMLQWENSEGHLANIVGAKSGDYVAVGIVIAADKKVWCTQTFGVPGTGHCPMISGTSPEVAGTGGPGTTGPTTTMALVKGTKRPRHTRPTGPLMTTVVETEGTKRSESTVPTMPTMTTAPVTEGTKRSESTVPTMPTMTTAAEMEGTSGVKPPTPDSGVYMQIYEAGMSMEKATAGPVLTDGVTFCPTTYDAGFTVWCVAPESADGPTGAEFYLDGEMIRAERKLPYSIAGDPRGQSRRWRDYPDSGTLGCKVDGEMVEATVYFSCADSPATKGPPVQATTMSTYETMSTRSRPPPTATDATKPMSTMPPTGTDATKPMSTMPPAVVSTKMTEGTSVSKGGAGAPSNVGSCATEEELSLCNKINEYRRSQGLPAAAISKSLTTVAQYHAWDTETNFPDTNSFNGGECNMHSWSNKMPSKWQGMCYTADHRQSTSMWSKPAEITGVYNSEGFEISYRTSGAAAADDALAGWRNSPGHNDVICENSMWSGSLWPAMGCGIYRGTAHCWFGKIVDPAGEMPAC
jgi:uncharacterized protein YkwD